MTETDEFSYMRNGKLLNPETIYSLRSLVARYPYYQTARLLLVKNLYNNKNADYEKELQDASLFASDRSVLFYMTEGGRYRLDVVSHPDAANRAGSTTTANRGGDRTSALIDEFLVAMPDDQPRRRLTLADAATDYAAYLAQQDDDYYGNAASKRGTNRSKAVGTETCTPQSHNVIAAKLEVENAATVMDAVPQGTSTIIVPENSNSAQENEGEENFFTETLAKIYIKQGKYRRAIEIMRRLEADYPKKSSYFADQIRFLEKMVINNKNKK